METGGDRLSVCRKGGGVVCQLWLGRHVGGAAPPASASASYSPTLVHQAGARWCNSVHEGSMVRAGAGVDGADRSCRLPPAWGLYCIVMRPSLGPLSYCDALLTAHRSHVGYIGGIEWTGHCKLLHLGMFAIACLSVSNMLLLRLLKGCSLEIFCGRNDKSSTARLYGRESSRIILVVVHGATALAHGGTWCICLRITSSLDSGQVRRAWWQHGKPS